MGSGWHHDSPYDLDSSRRAMGTLEARCSSTWWEVEYQCPAREERSHEIDFNGDPELIIESKVDSKVSCGR